MLMAASAALLRCSGTPAPRFISRPRGSRTWGSIAEQHPRSLFR